MSDTNIWEKYIQKGNIGKGKIIKAQNKKIGNQSNFNSSNKDRNSKPNLECSVSNLVHKTNRKITPMARNIE